MNHLDQIHIRNFRLFDSLDIEHVGKVNLITGKNNCGKTTLLEALRIWASRDNFEYLSKVVSQTIQNRGDFVQNDSKASMKSVFFNGKPTAISINELTLTPAEDAAFLRPGSSTGAFGANPVNGNLVESAVFIPASFDFDRFDLWETVDLTPQQIEVEAIMRIIEPSILRLSIPNRTPKVLLSNFPTPRPLKNFGEGMNRLLTIALGLVNAENSLLLIDEIDLGLHHSVQTKLWEIVFSTAKRLNVQVFATTHSKDCVQSFAEMADIPAFQPMINFFRIQKKRSSPGYMAMQYDLEDLQVSAEHQLETR